MDAQPSRARTKQRPDFIEHIPGTNRDIVVWPPRAGERGIQVVERGKKQDDGTWGANEVLRTLRTGKPLGPELDAFIDELKAAYGRK